jgi:hypothetical protein
VPFSEILFLDYIELPSTATGTVATLSTPTGTTGTVAALSTPTGTTGTVAALSTPTGATRTATTGTIATLSTPTGTTGTVAALSFGFGNTEFEILHFTKTNLSLPFQPKEGCNPKSTQTDRILVDSFQETSTFNFVLCDLRGSFIDLVHGVPPFECWQQIQPVNRFGLKSP